MPRQQAARQPLSELQPRKEPEDEEEERGRAEEGEVLSAPGRAALSEKN